MVEALQARGVNAVGLSGVDGAVLRGPRKAAITAVDGLASSAMVLRDDHTGKVTRVNTHLLHLLLAGGYLPVLCPPAISEKQRGDEHRRRSGRRRRRGRARCRVSW